METTTQSKPETENATPAKKWDKQKVGSLWRKTAKSGQKFLSGEIEIQDSMGEFYIMPVMIFPARFKDKEEGKCYPDYYVYQDSEPMKKDEWEKKFRKKKAVPQNSNVDTSDVL